jgi:hypothetical protein
VYIAVAIAVAGGWSGTIARLAAQAPQAHDYLKQGLIGATVIVIVAMILAILASSPIADVQRTTKRLGYVTRSIRFLMLVTFALATIAVTDPTVPPGAPVRWDEIVLQHGASRAAPPNPGLKGVADTTPRHGSAASGASRAGARKREDAFYAAMARAYWDRLFAAKPFHSLRTASRDEQGRRRIETIASTLWAAQLAAAMTTPAGATTADHVVEGAFTSGRPIPSAASGNDIEAFFRARLKHDYKPGFSARKQLNRLATRFRTEPAFHTLAVSLVSLMVQPGFDIISAADIGHIGTVSTDQVLESAGDRFLDTAYDAVHSDVGNELRGDHTAPRAAEAAFTSREGLRIARLLERVVNAPKAELVARFRDGSTVRFHADGSAEVAAQLDPSRFSQRGPRGDNPLLRERVMLGTERTRPYDFLRAFEIR